MVLHPWHLGGGNLHGNDTGREALSHTRLTAFLNCPQKYAYTYEQQLQPRAKAVPLTLGKAYQHAIEHSDPQAGVKALREATTVSSQEDADRLAGHEATVLGASQLYLRRFGPLDGTITATREYAYRVRLRNPTNGYMSRSFDLLGYADEWVDMGTHGALVENKLVGQITKTDIRKLPLDRQIALEAYGTWRATGLDVREVFYRFVRKPSIRQKKDERVEDYCDRILFDYEEREDFYCHEEHLLRSPADLLRIEAELWQWAEQIRALRAAPLVTRNSSHCSDYGGCAFMALCLGEPGAEGLYEHRPGATRQHAGQHADVEQVQNMTAVS